MELCSKTHVTVFSSLRKNGLILTLQHNKQANSNFFSTSHISLAYFLILLALNDKWGGGMVEFRLPGHRHEPGTWSGSGDTHNSIVCIVLLINGHKKKKKRKPM
jgi:hypothetical protein